LGRASVAPCAYVPAAARGASLRFLESGANNHGAHRFFARHGFAQCSVVMLKPLGDGAAGRDRPAKTW
jgi:hypothetical protein